MADTEDIVFTGSGAQWSYLRDLRGEAGDSYGRRVCVEVLRDFYRQQHKAANRITPVRKRPMWLRPSVESIIGREIADVWLDENNRVVVQELGALETVSVTLTFEH